MDEGQEQTGTGDPPVAIPTIDAATVAALYTAHAPELHRFILGVVRDADLAGDILQMTFTRALERGHTARPDGMKAWLFRVALNEALMARLRRAVGERAWQTLASRAQRTVESPEEALVRAETVAALRGHVAELPEDQRRVVLARLDEDKTFAQIADELGVPLGTVLTRMRRALERLRRALKGGA